MIKLYTDRLIIRDYCINDLDDHHNLLSDNKVMFYLQDIKTNNLEESKANLERILNDQKSNERNYYFFVIEEKTKNEFIGSIGYTVLDNTSYGKFVDLGYFILENYWNMGFTTEALKKVIEYSFNENNVYRIRTGCLKENISSEKVMLKCGFIKEGEFKEYTFHDGKPKDRVQYRLIRNEWKI